MSNSTLLSYYQEHDFNPVPIDLSDDNAWDAHVEKRRNLYERHLGIPFSLLKDRSVVEFGCNSGENALVLASIGASLTLVEPNEKILGRLRNLFLQHKLTDRITDVETQTIRDFESSQKYDLVIAEGFLNTLPDRDDMICKMADLLVPGGIMVISWDDRYGSLLEVTKRLVFKRACQLRQIADLHGDNALLVAQSLFLNDFEQLNASRPFDAWVRDVLASPFVSWKYLWSYPELLPVVYRSGCEFLSSSPRWVSVDQFSWYKDVPDFEKRCETIRTEWFKYFGFFLTGVWPDHTQSQSATPKIVQAVSDFVSTVSDFLDNGDVTARVPVYPRVLHDYLDTISHGIFLAFGEEMTRLFAALGSEKADNLMEIYSGCEILRNLWGVPAPYASFVKCS